MSVDLNGPVPTASSSGVSPLGADAFKGVFRRHPAGVAVITTVVDGQPVGFTATSVISVSADPPLLAFSVDSSSSAWRALATAEALVVNFLTAAQVEVSARFATSGIDRFAGVAWHRLPSGEPVVDGVPSWVRGEVLQRTAVGSSFLVAVLATRAEQRDGSAPLVYHDRAYHRVDDGSAV